MGNMYKVRTIFTGVTGTPYVNNLYFNLAGGTAAQANSAAGTFWGTIDNGMQSAISWSTDAVVQTIESATGEVDGLVSVTPQTGAGGSGTGALPWAAQGLCRWHTGVFLAGREVRGRTFFPAMTTSQDGAGVVVAGTVTAWQAAADALIADANSIFVVYSRKHRAFEVVTSAAIWTQWATMRSRRD